MRELQPEEWKNVGVSLIYAIQTLTKQNLDALVKTNELKDYCDKIVTCSANSFNLSHTGVTRMDRQINTKLAESEAM